MQSSLHICDLIGALAPGSRPLKGKSFYLDEVKSRSSSILTELIGRLGGKVEDFLNKDVSVIVTGNRESLPTRPAEYSQAALRKVRGEGGGTPVLQKERSAQRPGTPRPPVCGSRGKALLEKAICSQERSRASVLSSASSWGVKVVSVDDFLKFVNCLCAEISHKNEKSKEPSGPRIVKAGVLKADFVKVEDSSRKYRPLHAQCLPLPALSYTGRFSPFQTPAPARSRSAEQESSSGKPYAPFPHTPPRRKNAGYCECCQTTYSHLDRHLESELHRVFVLDVTNYAVVDQLVAGMDAGFMCCPNSRDDTLALRLSHGSRAPLNPCADLEDRVSHAADKGLHTGVHHLVGPGTPGPTSTLGPVPNPPPHAVETKYVDEGASDSLPLLPPPPIPEHYPSLETIDLCTIHDHAPLSRTVSPVPEPLRVGLDVSPVPKPLRVGMDGFISSTLKDALVADQECPSLVPSQPPALGEPDRALADHAVLAESPAMPGNVGIMGSEQLPGGESRVDGPLLSGASLVKLWATVNPRKRCRSFPLSPSPLRKARKCSRQMSDPTNENRVTSHHHDGPSAMDGRSDSVRQKQETLYGAVGGSAFGLSGFISAAAPHDQLPFQQGLQEQCVVELDPSGAHRSHPLATAGTSTPNPHRSSDLGPPELYPFFQDDDLYRQLPPYRDPPTLLPSITVPTQEPAHAAISHPSATSLLSQSFSSFCLEPALIPNFTSSTSSESDWDSGLLTRLVPAVHLQPRGGHCDLDVALLLQRSCAGVQDGSYASRLCSVLQPAVPAPTPFEERTNLIAFYRSVEAMNMGILQSLGM